jgi:hypothetical protein
MLCFLKLQVLFGRVLCVVSCLLLGFSWLLWLASGHDLESSCGSLLLLYAGLYLGTSSASSRCGVGLLELCCVLALQLLYGLTFSSVPSSGLPDSGSLDAGGLLQRISLPATGHCLGCAWVRFSPLVHNLCLLFHFGSSAGLIRLAYLDSGLWIPTVWVRFSPLIFGLHPCYGVGMVC